MPLFIKQPFFLLASLTALTLITNCKAPTTETKLATQNQQTLTSYPLKQHFKCLPDSAAILTAHRGTSKGKGLAENGKAGLEALINKGVMIAEIDVAKTKDGVHFLFHDGVWDDKSTGRGAIASSRWSKAEAYLLKDTEGRLTSETPISVEDYLKIAKDKIYLEIDFKSSSKYEDVIRLIRKHGMGDQVILISYSLGQARKLARLAPNMLVSVTVNNEGDLRGALSAGLKTKNIAAWTGRKGPRSPLEKQLKNKGIAILSYPTKNEARALINKSNIIVTDYALDQKPIIGRYDKAAYKSCLNQ